MGGSLSDNFDLSVVLKIAAQGGAKATEEVISLQDAVDNLNRTGALSEKELAGLTRALDRQSKSVRGAALTTDEAAKAEQRLLKVQRERAQVEAKELNRLMDASIKSRLQAVDAINAETEATNRLAQAKNSERASAFQSGGIDSRLGVAGSGQKASETGLAAQLRKEEADAIAKGTTEMQKSAIALKQEGDARKAELASLKEAITSRYAEADAAANSTESINAQRYALYEVAAAYGAVAATIGGVAVKTTQAFADMESGFTKVERTSGMYGEAFAPLEADILSLGRSIPTLTNEMQDLAARGAQMGIAADDVADFTEVMAKFVATSPEVDVNSVAEAFGRLSNLTGTDDFLAMASAIAQVGVNSAATDAQIIKTTQELARATSSTTLAADEVIGLAAAMASLGVAPEAARGVMNQFFVQLEKGAAGLNDSLGVAAEVMGKTEAEAKSLFETDTGTFFQEFVTGLTQVESVTVALDEMGLSGQRLIPAFNALTADTERSAAGQSVLAKALRDSNEGFRERAELDRQYAPIADDLNSKFILMQNAVMELAFQIGSEFAPQLKGMMDAVIGATQALSDFVNSPFGGFLTKMVAGLATVVGVYATLRSAIALSSAAMIAFRTASGSAVASGLAGSLAGLVGLFKNTSSGARHAAGSVNGLRTALLGLGRATVIGAVFQYIAEWVFNAGGAAESTGGAMIWLGNLMSSIAEKLGGFLHVANALTGGILGGSGLAASLSKMGSSLQNWGVKQQKANDELDKFKDTAWGVPPILDESASGADDFSDSLDGLGGSAADAAEEVRTLIDYANDLSAVWNRAFEIRFASGQAEDKITKTFLDLKKAAEDSAQKIKDIRGEIRGLNADIGVLQSDINTQKYFLSIALEYGDTKRAEAIQANLGKLQADLGKKQDDLKKKQKELTKEQEANSKALTGNSEQAIKNRETVLGLVQSYQSQVEALAKSGLSSDELARKTEQLRQDFIKQLTQLGFNRQELARYTKGFDDVRVAIDKVPRNITVKANANPAIQALEELRKKAVSTSGAVNGVNSALKGAKGGFGNSAPAPVFNDLQAQARKAAIRVEALARVVALQAQLASNSHWTAKMALIPQIAYWKGIANSFSSGGYTGPGGKYEPAGIVHKGEYVVPKQHVNQRTGLPYADAMGKLVKGSQPASRGYANGGFVGASGVGSVDLSAASIQHLAQALKTRIFIDGKMIGDAAGRSFASDSRVGAN